MQNLNKKKIKEVINVEKGKYPVKFSKENSSRDVESFEFQNNKGDTYLIMYSYNPSYQRMFYNNYKFKNYNVVLIQPDFGKIENGEIFWDMTNDRDVLNIYATLGNHMISKLKSLENSIPENTIVIYSIAARDIEPKKQVLYKKLIDKFISNLNIEYLGQKEVSYYGYDIKSNIMLPKVVYNRLQKKNELNEFLSMLDLSSLEEKSLPKSITSNKKEIKEVINVEKGKYPVKSSNKFNYPSVDSYEFNNSKGDTYLILYSHNPPFQRQFYNNYKFKNYNIQVIQPDFGKYERGGLNQDITNDRDALNIYATLGNDLISKFKKFQTSIPENTIQLYSIGARDIEPKKQKLYRKLVKKILIDATNSILLGEKRVSYAGYDLTMQIVIPKTVYDKLESKNELNDFLAMINLSPIQENFINYLSKELNISLSEAILLEKEIKKYSLNKSKLEEMSVKDIKDAIELGTITASVILSSFSPMQASSDYFRMTSYNPKIADLKKLSAEEQKKVIKYAISHTDIPSEKNKLQNLLNKLEKKESYLKKTNRRKKKLDEISFNDIKTGITIASIIASSFIPSLQKVTAEGCDESSCSIEALEAKQTIESKIDRIDNYLKKINFEDAKSSQENANFLKEDLELAKERLLVLLNQNLNTEQKKYLKTVLQKIDDAQKELNPSPKKQLNSPSKKIKKENIKLYLCKKLNISLLEATLIEKEIKNYTKIKKTFLKENENFIKYDERYKSELNSAKLYFNRFFTKYNSSSNKGDEEAINKMKEVFANNDIEYFKYAYPFADLYNLLHTVNNIKNWGIKEYPEIADEIEGLHYNFMVDFAEIIYKDSNPNYFFVKDKEYYSKRDFFLKIEEMSSQVLRTNLSQKFKAVFEEDLKDLI